MGSGSFQRCGWGMPTCVSPACSYASGAPALDEPSCDFAGAAGGICFEAAFWLCGRARSGTAPARAPSVSVLETARTPPAATTRESSEEMNSGSADVRLAARAGSLSALPTDPSAPPRSRAAQRQTLPRAPNGRISAPESSPAFARTSSASIQRVVPAIAPVQNKKKSKMQGHAA